jgi:hypothetical protein
MPTSQKDIVKDIVPGQERIRLGFMSTRWALIGKPGGWYYQGRNVLTETVAMHRIKLLTKIARLLLTVIPSERGYKMRQEQTSYKAAPDAYSLLDDIPIRPSRVK